MSCTEVIRCGRCSPELDRLGWVARLDLPRLTRREGRELMARLLGREPEPALADRVFSRSEGNPLFLEALLRCGESPALICRSRCAISCSPMCSGCPRETQEVLEALGVAGQRCGHALLAAVTGLGDRRAARRPAAAVSANVLVPDGDGYAFRHALIREAILGEVLPGEKTRWHTCLAEALAADPSLVPPGRAVIEQAHHWYAAHDIRPGAGERLAGGGDGRALPRARREAHHAGQDPRTVGHAARRRAAHRRQPPGRPGISGGSRAGRG